MVLMVDGLSFKHMMVFVLLTHFYQSQMQEISTSQPITALVGDDVVLPCHLEAPSGGVQVTVEWGRPDLNPRFVYVWYDGQEVLDDQNKAFEGRASLSFDKLKHGDFSLKLSEVKYSDNGRYRCYIPEQKTEYFVELLVGDVSSPDIIIAGLDESSRGVMLDCKSAGWYPEPEVLWLDAEGNLLSAGPTESVRGPDDLYTVSSRVTVEKRHSNSFTCRVQQNNINQTREVHISIADDFFVAPSNCAASITFSVVFCFILILSVSFFIWKRRQNKKMKKNSNSKNEDQSQLMKDLDKKKTKLEEELKKSEEEQMSTKQMIDALMEMKEELEEQNKQLSSQKEELEKEVEESEEKMKLVDKDVTEKKGDQTVKVQGFFKLEKILIEVIKKLKDKKNEIQQLQLNTEKLMMKISDEVTMTTERKTRIETRMEKMKERIEDIERQKK
ncbi:butyrophilin subfamily 3 member A2-like [Embiotoca jacksoni]|uniref:butyrophilin subfamily 3 member A2-like n=1 Tax=Embiotoca jacksoni TaxID=100190 RepID=UPI0037049BF7